MSDISDFMTATCNYEHRDGKGKLISIGKTKIDWLGNVHAIQKNLRTGQITESIFHSDGTLHKTVVKYPLHVKFLRLVGLKKKL
jgi:hypothetical protein